MKPAIVVRKNPAEVFYKNYGRGPGQKIMIDTYKVLMAEMYELRLAMPEIDTEVKHARKLGKKLRKAIELRYNALWEQVRIIEKHLDYGMVFTASLNDVNIIDDDTDWKEIEQMTGPFVVRAMASKKFIDHATKSGKDYIFLENGYFGNYKNSTNIKSKKVWHRICINEVQQENILKVPSDRWDDLVKHDMKLEWRGWRKTGSRILVVLPSPKPCEYYGQDVHQWREWVMSELRKYTDREIVVREKSSRPDRVQQTIYQALDDDIFCTVTYQSIAAVESVAYGIPAFTLAPSAAKPVSLQDLSKIETPYYPDEELVRKWCCSLAYGQFSMDEMLNGSAWKIVQDNKDREKINY